MGILLLHHLRNIGKYSLYSSYLDIGVLAPIPNSVLSSAWPFFNLTYKHFYAALCLTIFLLSILSVLGSSQIREATNAAMLISVLDILNVACGLVFRFR